MTEVELSPSYLDVKNDDNNIPFSTPTHYDTGSDSPTVPGPAAAADLDASSTSSWSKRPRRVSTIADQVLQATAHDTTDKFLQNLATFIRYVQRTPLLLGCIIAVSRLTMAADIVTDAFVVSELYQDDHLIWASFSLLFLCSPYICMWFLLVPVARLQLDSYDQSVPTQKRWSNSLYWFVRLCILLLGLPALILMDIVLLTVYLWRDLPATNVYLSLYTRQRSVLEVALESIPQLFLQCYIRFFGSGVNIDDLSLILSILASVIALIKTYALLYIGSRALRIGFWRYARIVVTLAGGDVALGSVIQARQTIRDATRTSSTATVNVSHKIDMHNKDLPDVLLPILIRDLWHYHIEHLDLSQNVLTDQSIRELAIVLPQCKSLQHLDVSCNTFTNDSANELARMITKMPALTHLDASLNKFDLVGITTILDAIPDSKLSTAVIHQEALLVNNLDHDQLVVLGKRIMQIQDNAQVKLGDRFMRSGGRNVELQSSLAFPTRSYHAGHIARQDAAKTRVHISSTNGGTGEKFNELHAQYYSNNFDIGMNGDFDESHTVVVDDVSYTLSATSNFGYDSEFSSMQDVNIREAGAFIVLFDSTQDQRLNEIQYQLEKLWRTKDLNYSAQFPIALVDLRSDSNPDMVVLPTEASLAVAFLLDSPLVELDANDSKHRDKGYAACMGIIAAQVHHLKSQKTVFGYKKGERTLSSWVRKCLYNGCC
jgi:XK-related protein/Ras family/Leucine Rich repeat